MESYGRLTDEWFIGTEPEESNCDLIEVLSRNLSGETEENKGNLSHVSQCHREDSDGALPEHQPTALSLDETLQ
jgi:hypothetical protein